MSEQLLKHICKYASISDIEFLDIQSYFTEEAFNKKENLIQVGEKCTHNYFVLEGCLQMYSDDEAGVERTVQFALENWWMTDNLAFINQQKSKFCIQAVETSKVLSISFEKQNKLLDKYPQLEKYFRNIYQIAYGAAMGRMKIIFEYSKAERYFQFIGDFPDFAQRVPQYLLASFLGLTPEYVSELRKKNRS